MLRTGSMTMRLAGTVLVLAIALLGCSQSLVMQGKQLAEEGRHDQAIDLLYREIASSPDSYQAWRELGVAFYRKGDLVKAEDALQQANSIQPHARTSLYLGLINEKRGLYEEALQSYRAALALDPKGDSKKYINAHLDQLIAKKVAAEVDQALASETEIDVASIPDNSVAVADFDAENLPPDLKPLARGLAEFTAADLAKINSLKVVDRLKLEVIQQELELSRSGMVDQSSAPRIGKLLGTRHLVTATLMDIEGQNLRLDGVVVNTLDSTTDLTNPTQSTMQQLFTLQKDFVFQIVDQLGITLSAAERDAIQEVPTESFLAFLAYSKGLEHQRAGRFDDAAREFNTAAQQDPGFGAAKASAQAASASMSMGGGAGGHTTTQFEAAMAQFASANINTAGLERRLTALGPGIGSILQRITTENPPTSPPEIPGGTATVIIEGGTDAN
ncbi:tetratricopeptide repeat protein, partial [candidate division GN15 bacterium]|nr:tetratricopeptide repeat protein [candidate division GN15 bacterium]